MMQITDLAEQQKIPALFRLGFRPFFLFGAIFSILAIFLWLALLNGTVQFSPFAGGYWWHVHEMIFGFGGAIIAGFLLTAVQNWTNIPGIQGKKLAALFLLWLLGRIALFQPALFSETIAMIIDLAFFPCVAYVLGKPIVAIKQYRNLFFIPLLGFFSLVNIEMYLSVYFAESFSIKLSSYAGVMLTTLLISIMAGRVTPMFTANGTKTEKILPVAWLEKVTNGSLALSAILLMLHPIVGFNAPIFGSVLIIAGLFQLARWIRWKPWITVFTPLLWSLHLSIMFVGLALVLLGTSYLTITIPSNHIWHLLTVGGMSGIILAMISRVALGHTGRKLIPAKIMSLAYISIFIAALVRAILPWFSPVQTMQSYSYSAVLWALAFGIFILVYTPILSKPRVDGRPG